MFKRLKKLLKAKDEIRITWHGNLVHAVYIRSSRLMPESGNDLWQDVVMILRDGEIRHYGRSNTAWNDATKTSSEYLILFDGLIQAIATIRDFYDRAKPMPEGNDPQALTEIAKRNAINSQFKELEENAAQTVQQALLRLEREVRASVDEKDFSEKILIAKTRLAQDKDLLNAFDEVERELIGKHG